MSEAKFEEWCGFCVENMGTYMELEATDSLCTMPVGCWYDMLYEEPTVVLATMVLAAHELVVGMYGYNVIKRD